MNSTDHILIFGAEGKRHVTQLPSPDGAQVFVTGLGVSGLDAAELHAAIGRTGGIVVSLRAAWNTR